MDEAPPEEEEGEFNVQLEGHVGLPDDMPAAAWDEGQHADAPELEWGPVPEVPAVRPWSPYRF
jgi:hypothetical protein